MQKVKFKLYAKILLGYLVILVALFCIAWVQDKVLNTIIILMSYLSTRWVFPTTYHANTDSGCLKFSIACFCIAVTITIPLSLSITSSVIIGAVISLFLFLMQTFIDLIKPKSFNVNNCTEAELIARCQELHFSERNTSLAIEYFIKKTRHREIAEIYCIEEDSSLKCKMRMKKLLNKADK